MKYTLLPILLFFPGFLLAQQLKIEVNGIEEIKGNLRVGIFTTQRDFPDDEAARFNQDIPVKGKRQTVVFPNLPKGHYAVAVYHDENKDQELSTNFLGMPTEDYGFSNNARATFSAPDYEDCTFYFDGMTKTVSINLE